MLLQAMANVMEAKMAVVMVDVKEDSRQSRSCVVPAQPLAMMMDQMIRCEEIDQDAVVSGSR